MIGDRQFLHLADVMEKHTGDKDILVDSGIYFSRAVGEPRHVENVFGEPAYPGVMPSLRRRGPEKIVAESFSVEDTLEKCPQKGILDRGDQMP